jgi:hypothetical protein
MTNFKFPMTNYKQFGLATLPTIMAMSVLVLGIAVTVGFLTGSEGVVSTASSQSSVALDFAQVGAEDALRKIAKDKTYNCTSADCYSIDIVSGGCTSLDGCATVSVSSGVGSVGDPKVVTAKGKYKNITRTLVVSVVYDASSFGEIATTTWVEE